jgi:hypothetical protein
MHSMLHFATIRLGGRDKCLAIMLTILSLRAVHTAE